MAAKKKSKFENKFKSTAASESRTANVRDERKVKDEQPKLSFNFKDFDFNQCPPGQTLEKWQDEKMLDKLVGRFVEVCSFTRQEAVQQGLLKLLEGSMVNVPPKGGRKHPDQDYIHVDTRNILFICGGAFDGIERKIAQRLNTHVVGFDSVQNVQRIDTKNLMKYIQPQDLKSFGLIPEIIGRLPVLTYLNPLDRQALRNILTEPKNSIVKQQVKLFEMDGIELSFEPEMFDYVVDKAVEYKLGARGLRSIMETIMIDAQFDAPSCGKNKLVITADYARQQMEKSQRLQS